MPVGLRVAGRSALALAVTTSATLTILAAVAHVPGRRVAVIGVVPRSLVERFRLEFTNKPSAQC